MQQALSHAAEQQSAERRVAAGADDDHIGPDLAGDVGDDVRRAGRRATDLPGADGDARLLQLGGLALDLRPQLTSSTCTG
jgi:hypothetical protein